MPLKNQAEMDRLVEQVNRLATSFVADPEAGRRAGYRPKSTTGTDQAPPSAEPELQVQREASRRDWLEAIARKDLVAWRWKIDRRVIPAEIMIIDRH